jgi:integrase
MRASSVTHAYLLKLAQKWLAAGKSKATCNRRMATLRRAYRLARRDERIARIPQFPHFSEIDAVRTGFVEPADFVRFLMAIPDPDVRDLVEWLGVTGQRVGEARKLQWKFLQGNELHIPAPITKARKARVIPLVADLARIIEHRRTLRRLDCSFIFHREGRAIVAFRYPWRAAVRATSLRITPHDLRRSGVRNLIQAGVDRDVARMISGHRTDSVFSRYNIVSPEQTTDALKKLAAYTAKQRAKPAKVSKIG